MFCPEIQEQLKGPIMTSIFEAHPLVLKFLAPSLMHFFVGRCTLFVRRTRACGKDILLLQMRSSLAVIPNFLTNSKFVTILLF